jgi:hypothetical protein
MPLADLVLLLVGFWFLASTIGLAFLAAIFVAERRLATAQTPRPGAERADARRSAATEADDVPLQLRAS